MLADIAQADTAANGVRSRLRLAGRTSGSEGAGMPNFLVRIRESREAVGIFALEDLEDLAVAVDEVTDPGMCEYAELEDGAILWGRGATSIPLPDHCWADEHRSALQVIGNAYVSESWLGAFLRDDHLEFCSFESQPAEYSANDP